MENWTPLIMIVGGGIGIVAVTPFVDMLKSKINSFATKSDLAGIFRQWTP